MKTLPTTDIEYLTHHWPVVTGCSFGCPWCWARKNAAMRPFCHGFNDAHPWTPESRLPQPFEIPILHPDRLNLPLCRKKPARIGVCFTGDLFGPEVPTGFVDRVFGNMQSAPHHQFFILTKRAQIMQAFIEHYRMEYLAGFSSAYPKEYPHVFLGVSVTTQAEADERIPLLLATPAAKRWVSVEPMLGPVNLEQFIWGTCIATREVHDRDHDGGMWCDERSLDFVVVGSIDRPSPQFPAPKREWIESIVDQCRAAGVPVWVKNNAQYLARRDAIRPGAWPQELPI